MFGLYNLINESSPEKVTEEKVTEGKNPATENLGIIVGAGPVGLYAAFILLMQGVNVTMYEPREKFKDRRQVVQVNSNFSQVADAARYNTQDRWMITYPALYEELAKVGCPIGSLGVGTFLWAQIQGYPHVQAQLAGLASALPKICD